MIRTLIPQSRWRLTIFPKLFIALLIVVVPLYGIALTMNQLGQSRLEEELSKSIEAKVDFYLNSLEVEHEHMLSLLQEYAMDKDIQHLTYLRETMQLVEFTDAVRRVKLKLEQLTGSSIYAKSVSAHILTLGRSIGSEFSILAGLAEEYAAVEPLTRNNGSGLFLWQDRLFLATSYPGIQAITMEPGFILAIELDLNEMQRGLTAFNDYEQSGAVLLYTTNRLALASNDQPFASNLQAMLMDKHRHEDFKGLERVRTEQQEYVIGYKYSEAYDYYLSAFIPTKQIIGSIDTYRNWLWLLSLVAILIIILYSYWIYRLIHRPLHNLVKGFRKVEQRQLVPIPLPNTNDEFLYLFQRFNMMVNNLNELIHTVYEQQLRAQSSELKQLQAQINPHFLYNTYFILYRLAKMNDNESIARFSQYLGEYFQYITRNAADEIPLEMEFKHSLTYAEIQNIRFQNRILVEFKPLDEAVKAYRVPRLILQPVVENAYKYGLESRRRQGRIVVQAYLAESALIVSVEDNGHTLTDDKLAELQNLLLLQGDELEYTGLLNVHRRLQIRFGEQSGVYVSRSELGGLRVGLKLPWPLNTSE